ncbi:MAG: hypothetical protein NUV64_02680 [Parcubacteria group bacterium]|nr:hypothetical protein [Parcubacteria group bacterium]MCR4342921.1 hypothetical protein [Patescibacteria group bacterium]
MKGVNLAVCLSLAVIALLAGCASQKELFQYSGPPPEAYGKYAPYDVEDAAKNAIVHHDGDNTVCPKDDPVSDPGRQANYIHLGRNPVDPDRGYDSGKEFLVRLKQDKLLKVEQKGGKWVKGTLPLGTVLVVDTTGKVLRICSCANGVTLLSGEALRVELPAVSLEVETLPPAGVTSSEAILQGVVTSKDQAIAWFVYWRDGGNNKFATRPQYANGGLVESKLTNLDANSRYFYQAVAINIAGKREGGTFWFLTDRNCIGKGTIASGTGGFFLTFGLANIANPVGWGSMAVGTGLSAYGIIDKDSDPTCKAVAGLFGGTVGAISGISYHNARQSGSVSSGGPGSSPPTEPGPEPPNGPASVPGN